jgi:hypothetical protein
MGCRLYSKVIASFSHYFTKIMQATQQNLNPSASKLSLTSQPAFFQSILQFRSEWIRALVTLSGIGAAIAVVLAFQQFLIQVYILRWQMALLFALLGLMVVRLLGHYSLRQDSAINGSALSSLIVTLFGMGMIVCILATPSPFV